MKFIYILCIVLLLFTVPWFFTNMNMHSILGFPDWALYSLIATLVYSIIISYFLKKYWFSTNLDN